MTFEYSIMDQNDDGDGWKYGLCFIFLGIVFVLSMGVFSMLSNGGRGGKLGCCFYLNSLLNLLRFSVF